MTAARDHFGARLRRARERSGLSQSALARRVGWLPGEVCNYEAGRKSPNLVSLARLCRALRVSADSLVFGRRVYK